MTDKRTPTVEEIATKLRRRIQACAISTKYEIPCGCQNALVNAIQSERDRADDLAAKLAASQARVLELQSKRIFCSEHDHSNCEKEIATLEARNRQLVEALKQIADIRQRSPSNMTAIYDADRIAKEALTSHPTLERTRLEAAVIEAARKLRNAHLTGNLLTIRKDFDEALLALDGLKGRA